MTNEPRHKTCRRLRLSLGLTQAELGMIIGVGQKAVQRWETRPGLNNHRHMPDLALRVLMWMNQPGRPKAWPRR